MFYIITMGEKSTGGYFIEIVDLELDKDGKLKVTAKENTPNGELVTCAITHPAVCLELSRQSISQIKSIEIKNTEGEVFTLNN